MLFKLQKSFATNECDGHYEADSGERGPVKALI
jgi:hypothetical protein